jgi:hypothetical protein
MDDDVTVSDLNEGDRIHVVAAIAGIERLDE